MSRFFEEIEFKDPEDPAIIKQKTIVIWDKDKLDVALKRILEEIGRIKKGTSEYVPRAIDPGTFGFPAENAIKIFVSDPSDKRFVGIREICRQDFMARAGDFFYTLLKECREEKINV